MFALSSKAIPFTPYLPVSSVSATKSSAVKLSSSVAANALCKNASTSPSSCKSAFACFEYAESPLRPYIISSLRLLISSFSVARTPTVAAFVRYSLSSYDSQRAASGRLSLFESSFKSSFLTSRVFLILAIIASLSKFAFVIVMKRFKVIRWFTSLLISFPSARSLVVTADIPLLTYISKSCIFATSGFLPQTPT